MFPLSSGWVDRTGKSMAEFAAPKLEKVRIGLIGTGHRGTGAVQRLSLFPEVEIVALCDKVTERAEKSAEFLVSQKRRKPIVYGGDEEIWRKLCERDDLDLVYICSPWLCHTPMAVYAMECGKHAVTEVPAAVTLEQCWQLVDTSEKTRKHCMMLENCCYGESELLALTLSRKGVLGELVHGEGAYIHTLSPAKLTHADDAPGVPYWRLAWSQQHNGNPYPTHGLGPICMDMDINRGDRMLSLVSMSSNQFGLSRMAERLKAVKKRPFRLGDVNNTIIKTYRGRTILIQHDTTLPRPYNRLNLIAGTKGILADYPLRVALYPNAHSWLPPQKLEKLREKYKHPLWKFLGEKAKKEGGHGGMDYLMDYRLIYCLCHGEPLDMNVYDAAAWSSLVELTETSVLKGSQPIDIPDFTRGGWKVAPSCPLGQMV